MGAHRLPGLLLPAKKKGPPRAAAGGIGVLLCCTAVASSPSGPIVCSATKTEGDRRRQKETQGDRRRQLKALWAPNNRQLYPPLLRCRAAGADTAETAGVWRSVFTAFAGVNDNKYHLFT